MIEAHISAYDRHAADLCARYDQINTSFSRQAILEIIGPIAPEATALDVGAGSGRDARWLQTLGFNVTAIEPSHGMRTIGQAHPDNGKITWKQDALPGLTTISETQFDLVLCWAVWQHVDPKDHDQAFQSLMQAVKPGGNLVIMTRIGAAPDDRPMHHGSLEEIPNQWRKSEWPSLYSVPLPNVVGREDCQWVLWHLHSPVAAP